MIRKKNNIANKINNKVWIAESKKAKQSTGTKNLMRKNEMRWTLTNPIKR